MSCVRATCSIDPTSDDTPLPFASLWDENDIRAHALMTEAVHATRRACGHRTLARRRLGDEPHEPHAAAVAVRHFVDGDACRLHGQSALQDHGPRRHSRLLRWQAERLAGRKRAGFDIVYVYAGMGYLPYEFLLPEWNQRTDAYGGSIANRVRFVREMLEVTKDAVGRHCAVALRISLEELRGPPQRAAPNPRRMRWSHCSPSARSVGREDGLESDRLLAFAIHAAKAATSR